MNKSSVLQKAARTSIIVVLLISILFSSAYAALSGFSVSAAGEAKLIVEYELGEYELYVNVSVVNPSTSVSSCAIFFDYEGIYPSNYSNVEYFNGASYAFNASDTFENHAGYLCFINPALAASSTPTKIMRIPFSFSQDADISDVKMSVCNHSAFLDSAGGYSKYGGAFVIENDNYLCTADNTLTVEFGNLPVNATGVDITDTAVEIPVGSTKQLTANVTPSNAINKKVTWTSNNTSVATVDANGVVSALKEGQATITVTTEQGGFTDTCTVKIVKAPATITSIDNITVQTYVGLAPELPAELTANMSDGTTKKVAVTWETVDASKYAQEGTFDVNFTVPGTTATGKATVSVVVPKAISEITPTTATTTAEKAPTLPSKVTVKYSDGTTGEERVTWETIDSSKYAAPGTFEVKGSVYNTELKAVCTVTVNEKKAITSIEPCTVTVVAGETFAMPKTVKCTYNDGDVVDHAVEWDVIDEDKLKGEGTFDVYGTVEGTSIKAKCTVTITPPPTITKIADSKVSTTVSKKPSLPKTVTVTYSDGTTGKLNVVWDNIDGEDYATVGTFTVNGKVEGTDIVAKCVVTVKKATDPSPSTGESILGVLIALALFTTGCFIAYLTWYKVRQHKLVSSTGSEWCFDKFYGEKKNQNGYNYNTRRYTNNSDYNSRNNNNRRYK